MNPSRTIVTLWTLCALFVLRVTGQVLVAFFDTAWLPPMSEWQSGVLPYPILLISQIAIIVLLVKVCLDFSRGRGFFLQPRAWFGRPALWMGYMYFAGMLLRYALRMQLHPEARWFGGTIPIFFHCVLASFIMTFARAHQRRTIACT